MSARAKSHSALGGKGDNMRLFVFLTVIFCAAIPLSAQPQSSLTGLVSDANGPVAGAEVTLKAAQNGRSFVAAKTDAGGRYSFSGIPSGDYLISAAIVADGQNGFSPETPVAISRGNPLTLDLQITQYAPIRAEVTVNISAGDEQPFDQVSKTVSVIDGREMRERADITLVDSLRSIPGFRVQQLGGFGRAASIRTRGLRSQDTAVLIDGIRLRDAAAITGDASPFLGDITLTSVSRVEVLRGPGSSLYGTNAVGGTIDFKTPLPTAGPHGQVSGAGGGLGMGRFRGNFSDGTQDGKFGFNTAISRTVFTEGIDGQDNAHNTNFQSRIEYNPTQRTNISGRFFVSDAFVRLNSSPDTFGAEPFGNSEIIKAIDGVNFSPDANDPDSFQWSNFFSGQVAVSHIFGPTLLFQGHYSGLDTSRKNDDGPLGVGFQSASTSFFDGEIHTANGRIKWTPNTANDLTVGYEYEYEKFGNTGRTPDGFGNFFTRASQTSSTIFLQELLSLADGKLQLAGGFRAQFFDLRTPRFSLDNAPFTNLNLSNPDAAITFDGAASYLFAGTGTKLRVHAGNGYRAPSLFERFGTFFSSFGEPSFIALGDPNLGEEKTFAFDAGIDQSAFDGKAKFSAVYFYTKLLDTIGFGNIVSDIGDTTRPFGGFINTDGGIARGGEFSGTIEPMLSTRIFASFTYTNSDQRVPQVTGSGVISTLGIPERQFTLVATQEFNRFWVNFDLLATSSYLAPIFSNSSFNTFVFRFDGNRRGDLTAGYNFRMNRDRLSLRLFGTIENLFDDDYFENGFRTARRTGRIGLSFGF